MGLRHGWITVFGVGGGGWTVMI